MTASARTLRAPRPLALLVLGLAAGCIDDPVFDENGAAPASTAGEVFTDGFGANVDFKAFASSKLDALYGVDPSTAHSGRTSLRVDVPDANDASGGFAGGAFVSSTPRDLSGYNALVFWAKSGRAATIAATGFGNDNTGTSKYTCERRAVSVTTEWQRFVIPMPAPARYAAERGLFYFSVAAEAPTTTGFPLWLDDVTFAKLPTETLGALEGSFSSQSATLTVGQAATVSGTKVVANVSGASVDLVVAPGVFDFASSSPTVATVDPSGAIRAVAVGSARVSASLAGTPVSGEIAVNVVNPADGVIAFLSATYPQKTVEKWLADWSMPSGQVAVSLAPDGADPQRTYTNLLFAGIEFTAAANQIDASAMTKLHVDLKSEDATELHLKLVDFGPNGTSDPPYDGGAHGDDSSYELVLTASSTPAFVPGSGWTRVEVPLSALRAAHGPNATSSNLAHLAQIALAGPSTGSTLVRSVALKNLFLEK